MTDTMEPLAIKTPTFEQARDAFRGVWAGHRTVDDCLMWMLDALHAEIADEREIVRGQAAVIAQLGERLAATQGRLAAHLHAAADYWTVQPDEPENFAANYPAAAKADPS